MSVAQDPRFKRFIRIIAIILSVKIAASIAAVLLRRSSEAEPHKDGAAARTTPAGKPKGDDSR
jgi:hypothetical protein